MPKSKKEGKEGIFYVRARSLGDVMRCACKFDYTSDPLLLCKTGKETRLIAMGSKIGDATLAYYVAVRGAKRLALYAPASEGKPESATFVDRADPLVRYYLSVIGADLREIRTLKEVDKKAAVLVKIENTSDLIGFAIKKAAKDESLSQLFSFDWKGRRVVGAFNLVDGLADGKTAFYYSFCEEKTLGFARYDYREDRVDFSDSMGEHAYMYAKVVNLAEPFPFFKP